VSSRHIATVRGRTRRLEVGNEPSQVHSMPPSTLSPFGARPSARIEAELRAEKRGPTCRALTPRYG
jgi:hypothetical protein